MSEALSIACLVGVAVHLILLRYWSPLATVPTGLVAGYAFFALVS